MLHSYTTWGIKKEMTLLPTKPQLILLKFYCRVQCHLQKIGAIYMQV